MPIQFQPVRPGDLITAELFNALQGRLAEIEDLIGGQGGLVEVPRLVGLTLGQAQSQLAQSGSNFTIDEAFDTLGASINPNTNEARARRVLNQVPSPNARVASAGPIDVVLSATGSSVPTTPVPNITGVSPQSVELGAEMTLTGINFGSPPGMLVITMDNVQVDAVLHQPQTIRFRVPQELPNVPSAGRNTTIEIITDGGKSSSDALPINQRPRVMPASGTLPTINSMTNAAGSAIPLDGSGQITIGQSVTIIGQNFRQTAGQNQLVISTQSGDIFRPVSSATTEQLTFTLGALPGQSQANRFIQAQLAVQSGDDTASRSTSVRFLFVLPIA